MHSKCDTRPTFQAVQHHCPMAGTTKLYCLVTGARMQTTLPTFAAWKQSSLWPANHKSVPLWHQATFQTLSSCLAEETNAIQRTNQKTRKQYHGWVSKMPPHKHTTAVCR